jgi:hypothetical protein
LLIATVLASPLDLDDLSKPNEGNPIKKNVVHLELEPEYLIKQLSKQYKNFPEETKENLKKMVETFKQLDEETKELVAENAKKQQLSLSKKIMFGTSTALVTAAALYLGLTHLKVDVPSLVNNCYNNVCILTNNLKKNAEETIHQFHQ